MDIAVGGGGTTLKEDNPNQRGFVLVIELVVFVDYSPAWAEGQ